MLAIAPLLVWPLRSTAWIAKPCLIDCIATMRAASSDCLPCGDHDRGVRCLPCRGAGWGDRSGRFWGVTGKGCGQYSHAGCDTACNFYLIEGLALVKRTHDFCASFGTSFGYCFSFAPGEAVGSLTIKWTAIHPPLISWTGSKRSVDSRESVLHAGQIYYDGWEFRDTRGLVDGAWHFSVAIQGKIVLEQDFTVHTGCGRPIS
jgi:hypothetical protein